MSDHEPLLGPYPRKHRLAILTWACVIPTTLCLILLALLFAQSTAVDSPPVEVVGKKNVIMMVTDGMGPALVALARGFKQYRDNGLYNDTLTLDSYLIGLSRTRLLLLIITDLAAGATAFLCAMKLYNGAIGVLPDGVPCGTILEALKLQGYKTGMVVTTRITDATPGAFSAHVNYRSQEDQIAEQQLFQPGLGLMVDLMIGGGRCHFVPGKDGGCRVDDRNLVDEAISAGWGYFDDREGFDKAMKNDSLQLPVLGLLADGDIPYDIDRDHKEYPLLKEQVQLALKTLSAATADSENGFFLLIEGLRIDHAGHHNDPAAQVREVLAYDDAFAEVIEFIDNCDVPTVMVLTLDHETGGLVTARQVLKAYPDYLWYPEVLLAASHSGEYMASLLSSLTDDFEKKIAAHLGIDDLSKKEKKRVEDALKLPQELLYVVNDIVSVRLQTGWTTHGHSAVDVNIYAHTNSKAISASLGQLQGNHENIEVGQFLAFVSAADLEAATEKVKHADHKPRPAGDNIVDAYHLRISN